MSSIAARLISDLQVGALSPQSWSQLGVTVFVCPASKKLLCVHTGVHTAYSWAPNFCYRPFGLRTGSLGRVTTLRLPREMIWARVTKIPGGQGFVKVQLVFPNLSARPLYDPPQSRTDPFNRRFQLQWLQAHVPIVQVILWSNYGKRLRRRDADVTGSKVGIKYSVQDLHVFHFGPMVQLTDDRCRLVHVWVRRRFVTKVWRSFVPYVGLRAGRWRGGTARRTRKGPRFVIFIGPCCYIRSSP